MNNATQPRLLLIDNYDSFTYNLVQAFLMLVADVRVSRNDAISVEEAKRLDVTHLCISPGPGTPHDAGVSMDMIRAFAGKLPIFGVCLGHQSIVEVFGGDVVRAPRLRHGKTSMVKHDGRNLFRLKHVVRRLHDYHRTFRLKLLQLHGIDIGYTGMARPSLLDDLGNPTRRLGQWHLRVNFV